MPRTPKITCIVAGCDQPRMVTEKGHKLTMCETHQRDYWRDHAAKKRDGKAAAPADLRRLVLGSDAVGMPALRRHIVTKGNGSGTS